jgi:NADH-quinone oxidoreductase subunit E
MDVDTKKISTIIEKYQGKKSALIAILQDIQEHYNWLPPRALRYVSEKLCVSLTDIYGVVTFYHAFRLTPRGKHLVTVCLGTACHVRGAPHVLNRFEEILNIESGGTTKDKMFTLETANCLGCCAIGPIVVVDGTYHGHTTIQDVNKIVGRLRKKPKRKTKK